MSLRGQWLILGWCVLCLGWLPLSASIGLLLGALWYHHRRFHHGSWLFLFLCVAVLLRMQLPTPTSKPTSKIVQIHQIRASYCIAKTAQQNVVLYGVEGVGLNDILELRGSYETIESIHNQQQFSFATWAKRHGYTYSMDVKEYSLLTKGKGLRSRLYEHISTMEAKPQQFVKAMLYGIQKEDAGYLLVSSGMHIAFVMRLLRRMIGKRLRLVTVDRILFLGLLLLGYVCVWTPSLMRLLMFALIRLLFPQWDGKDRLGITMWLMLLLAPYMAYEVSLLLPVCFQMAYLFNHSRRSRLLIAFLILFPVQFWFYHTFDPIQFLFFSILRLLYGLLYISAWVMLLPFGTSLYPLCNVLLDLLQKATNITIPLYGSVAIPWLLAWILSAVYLLSRKKRRDLVTLGSLTILFFILPYLSPFASVTMLDVGQGDCTLIVLPYHKGVYLIDVMGHRKKNIPEDIIVPYLHAQGIHSIDAVFVTHQDLDHSGGIEQLKQLIPVKKVINTKELAKHQSYPHMKFLMLNYDGEDENDNSIVTFLRLYDTSFLFMGDLGIKGEQELLNQYPKLEADVLKVGHHGSRTSSSTAFIHQIHPTLALISCGRHNVYGHPHKEVETLFQQEEVAPLVTSRQGSVTIKICKYFSYFETAEQQFGIMSTR